MRGSVALSQEVDAIWTLQRDKNVDNQSWLRLDRARHKLAKQGARISLAYNPATTSVMEVKPDRGQSKEIKNEI